MINKTDEQMSQSDFFPVSAPSITSLEETYVSEAMQSGWISSLGKFIDRFEEDFAHFCGTKDAICVSNGTVGIQLALAALEIGRGDEVLVPDLSFIATANAVKHVGAVPVFVDIQEDTLCIDPMKLEQSITSRTRAVMPVHLYGHPAEMEKINQIAESNDLLVIEDAAEAHGAEAYGKRVGGLGFCGIFSFYGNKNLTTGEGGMITTNNSEFASRCRRLRDHAMSESKRYWHTEPGYNFRMTNVQAAIGCAQLERSHELIEGRRQICEWYREELEGVKTLRLNRRAKYATPASWMACLEVNSFNEKKRNDFIKALRNMGVDSRPYFYPMSDMPYFSTANTPVTHEVYAKGLNLPTYISLTRQDISVISSRVRTLLAKMGS